MARRLPISAREQRFLASALARTLNLPRGASNVLLLVLLVGLAVGGWWLWTHRQSPSAAPTTNPGQIRVATWNLRKFGDRSGPGQHPPDLVTIARIINDSNFDVVAIQEVQQHGQMVQKLRRQLNEPWRHAVSEATGNHERYGFLWRCDKVELIAGPRLLDTPDAQLFSRVPAMASFRAGNFDFILITAHLWYGAKANNAQRRQEAAALARLAEDLSARGPERDIIVLGDFNEMRSDGNLHLFEERGFMLLSREPSNLSSTEIYDNLLINPTHTREWTRSAGVVRFDETLFANQDKQALEAVSDHRPVWADFSTAGPDDD